MLFGPLAVPLALTTMGGSKAVNAAAEAYLLVRLYAAPFTLANFAIFGWLFGLGRSHSGMVLLILLNSANILLTIWFVLSLDMGVEGAALGTVAGEAVAMVAGLLYMAHLLRDDWHVPLTRLLNRAAFARFMALNSDIFIRSLVMIIAFALFTSMSARQGDTILAANELLMHFFMFGGFFLDGIAVAAEQLGGRAIGARYRPAFDQTVRLSLIWGVGLGAGLSLLMGLFGPYIIDWLTTAPEVRILSRDYLVWAALTPVVATLAFQMDGLYIGATWSGMMRNVFLLATCVFALSQYLLMPVMGNDGLWLAMILYLATRGLALWVMLPGRIAKAFVKA
jgi:multidrug resistance protein, MATE family